MPVRLIKRGDQKPSRKQLRKAAKQSSANQFLLTAQGWVDEFRAQKGKLLPSPFREKEEGGADPVCSEST